MPDDLLVRIIHLLRKQPGPARAVEELPGVRELVAGNLVAPDTPQHSSVAVLGVSQGRESR